MMPRLSRWHTLATLTMTVVLSACAGGAVPTTPLSASGQTAAGFQGADRAQVANPALEPDTTCPQRFLDCATVSKTKGAEIIWCYGPQSDPCSDSNAGKVKWSGVVCLAKGPTCKGPIKVLTAKWSGPFKCKASDKCKGTFELDTIKPGPGLKQTSKYLYKQDIHICKGASCEDAYIGLDVGP